MKLNETVISLRMGTAILLISVFVAVLSGASTYAYSYGAKVENEKRMTEAHRRFEKQYEELKHEIEVNHERALKYTDTEVGGLRADWERELNRSKLHKNG